MNKLIELVEQLLENAYFSHSAIELDDNSAKPINGEDFKAELIAALADAKEKQTNAAEAYENMRDALVDMRVSFESLYGVTVDEVHTLKTLEDPQGAIQVQITNNAD